MGDHVNLSVLMMPVLGSGGGNNHNTHNHNQTCTSPPPLSMSGDGVQQQLSGFMSTGDSAAAGGSAAVSAAPSQRPINKAVVGLTFPESLAADIKQAVLRFDPQPFNTGQKKFTVAQVDVNKSERAQSISVYFGVRLDIDGNVSGKRQQKWKCLASNVCRANRTLFPVSSDCTTGATSHLDKIHHIKSVKSQAGTKRYALCWWRSAVEGW